MYNDEDEDDIIVDGEHHSIDEFIPTDGIDADTEDGNYDDDNCDENQYDDDDVIEEEDAKSNGDEEDHMTHTLKVTQRVILQSPLFACSKSVRWSSFYSIF